MEKLSATIITYNEEKNIERCLKSLQGIADEIIIVDSFSTDKTKEICLKYNVKFFERDFKDYSDQKNWAVEQSNFPIILSIDADEELSEKLKNSISEAKLNRKFDGYYFNRMTNFCGKWIKHSGWYPDKQMRIWDKTKGSWRGKIHEKVHFGDKASIGFLQGNLFHYSFYTIYEHIAQINKFSEIRAEDELAKGKKVSLFKIIFSPFIKFITHYFLKLGFLDGFYGFVICINSAHANFLRYSKLRQKRNEQ